MNDATEHWDAAFERVESYLRAHQLRSRWQVSQLATEITLAARADLRPGESPVQAALRVADQRIGAWLTTVLGDSDTRRRDRVGVRGRLALVIADMPGRWSHAFLSSAAPPAELVAAMQAAYLEAGPELELSKMAPRPLDLGPMANFAGDTWETLRRWPWILPTIASVTLVAAAIIVWFLTR